MIALLWSLGNAQAATVRASSTLKNESESSLTKLAAAVEAAAPPGGKLKPMRSNHMVNPASHVSA